MFSFSVSLSSVHVYTFQIHHGLLYFLNLCTEYRILCLIYFICYVISNTLILGAGTWLFFDWRNVLIFTSAAMILAFAKSAA